MRVLHVIPGLGSRTGGPAVAVIETAAALEAAGVSTTIISTDQVGSAGTPSPITTAAMPPGAAECDIRLAAVRPPRRLAYSPQLDRIVRRELATADLVHVHSLFLHSQFSAGRRARQAGRPYVVSLRGAFEPALRSRGRLRKAATDLLWQKGMLARAAAIHVTSGAEDRSTRHVAPGVPRFVIPNIVRVPEVTAAADLERFGLDPARPVVTFLGRVAAKKRIDVLIDAIGREPLRDGGAQLAIVGPDGEGLEPALRRRAADGGVADDVHFVGMLTGEEKWAFLRASTVWALPSVGENFGIAVAEALAAGVPVVVSPQVNLAEDLAAHHAGVVAPGTVDGFAAALGGLLADRDERERLGHAARAFAERFRPEAVAPALVAMYEHALG